MSFADDPLVRASVQAIETAAHDLGVEPVALARRLDQAEIARLVRLLNACMAHVAHPQLRHRIESCLVAITEGRMPDQQPESELDWALKVAKGRRTRPVDASGDPADGTD